MGILLAFAPFIAFAVISNHAGPLPALLAGAAVAAFLVFRARRQGTGMRILEVGTCILFVAVAAYTWLSGGALSIIATRLVIDAGLLAIVLLSIALGRPFTMSYARESVPREHWDSPGFLRTNNIISAAWALAFAVMVAAEAALLLVPGLPTNAGVVVIVLALAGAILFTKSYAASRRQRA
ncbi:hypothetical protein [Roseomonas populi]|uniref:Uncharacterized protein n=1 Tax=Roseomonas populi TaxID=3121582 RepID=A0ABT1X250_9PROT|nr:hypothetical protein [Roseomonas pecuniae]MCR0981483.1 hypothetical protein [Roseomonas pecuniae]